MRFSRSAGLASSSVSAGSLSWGTDEILEEHFGQKTTGSFSLVVRSEEPGAAERLVPQVEAADERASAKLPTSQVAFVQTVSEDVVMATIVSA